jgi:hypothetical protein
LHRATSLLIVAIACVASTAAQSQQPIDAPILKPFADNRQWVLMKDMTYRIGSSTFAITVPKGFVTDFASIPEVFWSADLSPNGKYRRGAIVHDYLYWTQGLPRIIPDQYLEFGPLVLWPDYRTTLAEKGVHDTPAATNPTYCQAGNTTDVPGGQN